MKTAKIYALMAIAGVGLSFASCSDITDPVFQQPDQANFTIYNPPMQDQLYELTPNGTFELVLSGQPDYGFSAITQYRADVCMNPEFAEGDYRTLAPTGTGTLSRMTLKMEDLAVAMNELSGVTSEENYVDRGMETVYFRGVAYINGIEESYVTTSNYTTLNKVHCYYSLRLPKYIFCIGNYAGDWISPTESSATDLIPYRVSEKDDAIGSNIFYATIDFQENAPIFRFYTGLNGWDKPADFDGTGKTGPDAFFSLGAAGGTDTDTPVVFDDFVGGSTLVHGLAETKDSFSFPNYMGVVNMTIDLTDAENPVATFTTNQ